MNKTRLSEFVAENACISKRDGLKVTNIIINTIKQSLACGEAVKIARFGKFYRCRLKPRTGRHPGTGAIIEIPERRTVRFQCYKGLRTLLNDPAESAATAPAAEKGIPDRRAAQRVNNLPRGKAVVRVSGIPVCEFGVKDISRDGTGILVEEDSVVLRNLHVGMVIETHMVYNQGNRKGSLQKSKVVHITPQAADSAYSGFVLVGLKKVNRISIY